MDSGEKKFPFAQAMVPEKIAKKVEEILQALKTEFKNNFLALILYGSWAKGKVRQDSDIDLLAIFKKRVDKDVAKRMNEISSEMEVRYQRSVTLLPVKAGDFKMEKLPLFTAAKREGIIVFGSIDLKESPERPEVKYKDFFKKSLEFENQKVEIAKRMLQEGLPSGIFALCFVASKHLLQAGLAMKGVGFASKVKTLLPLVEEHFGSKVASSLKRLFSFYVETEYQFQLPGKAEATLAIEDANRVIQALRNMMRDISQ
ncbi:MAG: nucleotidyltransferase domain-containing protein [Candidatus Hydrothermarchaeota archaeon]